MINGVKKKATWLIKTGNENVRERNLTENRFCSAFSSPDCRKCARTDKWSGPPENPAQVRERSVRVCGNGGCSGHRRILRRIRKDNARIPFDLVPSSGELFKSNSSFINLLFNFRLSPPPRLRTFQLSLSARLSIAREGIPSGSLENNRSNFFRRLFRETPHLKQSRDETSADALYYTSTLYKQ